MRFNSLSTAIVNSSFVYNVWDSDNANNLNVVTANFHFTSPPNKSPVISVDPSSNPTLVTSQTATATFDVNLTDYLTDLELIVRVESISVAWNQLTSLRPATDIDLRTYSLFSDILAGDVLLPSVSLVAGT